MTLELNLPVHGMSLEELASLGSGASFWKTKSVRSVHAFTLTDGPHGVRKQIAADDHLGIAPSAPATCFPPSAGLGQSWDTGLLEQVGAALGIEAQARDVGVLLGPGVNIKRDLRCGRNFEYFSEDPVLSGVLGAAWVRGLQREGVGASVKHFAANNAEHDRMRSSSDVDARALREIYLRSFQRVVEDAHPWTVMCAYNRLNGVYVGESRWLLTDVLRGEWGFDGVVVSDWGAVKDRVASVAAGLDLEMPGGQPTDALVVDAVRSGDLDASEVVASAARVALLASRVATGRRAPGSVVSDSHHALAREAAARSIVMLKNDRATLPLAASGSIAVIGELAGRPRFQGGGSSRVNPTQVDVPLDCIRELAPDAVITYQRGYSTDDSADEAALQAEAVRAAERADAAVVFLGLGERQESEGFDRVDIDLPEAQLRMLAAVVAVQPATTVVLSHGGVLHLAPVAALVPAILDGNLLGQGGGFAIAQVLFGAINPSGRLTETVPLRLQDSPSYLNFPGENSHVLYGESIFVGYRWYDARDMEVLYPFGHGLSYTTFGYSDLALSSDEDTITATVTVTNTGAVAGREIVQFYWSMPDSDVVRPPRELKAFSSVDLDPGESTEVVATLSRTDLAYWDIRVDDWVVEGGKYIISVGASSRDLRTAGAIDLSASGPRIPVTADSTMGEVLANPRAAAILMNAMKGRPVSGESGKNAAETELGLDLARMMQSFPINRIGSFAGESGREALEQLLDAANS